LELERDPSRNPLFDIALVVQNFRKPGQEKREEEIEIPMPGQLETETPYHNFTTKVDMAFFINETDRELHIAIEYYTGIFKQEPSSAWHCIFKT